MIKKLHKIYLMILLQLTVMKAETHEITIYNNSSFEMPFIYFKHDPIYYGSTSADHYDLKKAVLAPTEDFTVSLEDDEVARGLYYALPRCQEPRKTSGLAYCAIKGDELIGKTEVDITNESRD